MASPGPEPQAETLLASVMQAHEAGRLGQAERLYCTMLQQNPQHADAL